VSQAGAKARRSRRGGGGADLISATRTEIEARLRELRPLVAEVPRLERALAALQAVEKEAAGQPPAPRTSRRRRGRPAGRGNSGTSTRADQFLALVRDRPGITAREAAQALGAAPTYVYRIAATLQKEGTIRKDGRSFVAPGTAGPAAPEQPGEGAPSPTGVTVSLPESAT
jgi:hypothetical protein